ncbi:SLATT domain-containing protein [Plesiomonas shigelloides]|uniref:SLATT domain-containing protein n=1 Tax=Plesiomonas shigelloides TaxID=703 RepID=UPI002FC92E31
MTKDDFERLKKDTQIVAYARFNKSKRLANKAWWSLFSITSLSTSIILIAICEKVMNVSKIEPILFLNKSVSTWILTTICSIVALIISVAISTARWDVENQKLNESGIAINTVSRLLDANKNSASNHTYMNLLNRYHEIISSNPVNHDEEDFKVSKWAVNRERSLYIDTMTFFYKYRSLIPFYLIAALSLSIDLAIIKNIAL